MYFVSFEMYFNFTFRETDRLHILSVSLTTEKRFRFLPGELGEFEHQDSICAVGHMRLVSLLKMVF